MMTWQDQVLDAMQDLYDITANQPIKLVIEGEAGDMSGTLFVKDDDHQWTMAECCDGKDDAIDCLIELMNRFTGMAGYHA